MDGLRAKISGWLWRGGAQVLLLILGLGVLFGGLITLAQMTRAKVRDSDRYTARFADIECNAPPDLSRADFLNEVRYLTDFPEKLHLLDDDLQERLYHAFGQHPWVEKVESVVITPPRQVAVTLHFRTPVLAIAAATESKPRPLGVVDRRGITLPASAKAKDLPVFTANSSERPGRAGTPWPDDGVTAAARTAWFLRDHQRQLHVTGYKAIGKGLVITTKSGASIVWGRPPGLEDSNEAPAAKKLERLLKYCSSSESTEPAPGSPGYDVRPLKDKTP